MTVGVGPVPVRHRRADLAAALRFRMPNLRGHAGAITDRARAASVGDDRQSSRCGPAHRRAQAADSRFLSPLKAAVLRRLFLATNPRGGGYVPDRAGAGTGWGADLSGVASRIAPAVTAR
jgi:hypothetical protein